MAATKESGITDLNQIRSRKGLRVLLDNGDAARKVLAYYGQSPEQIAANGGRTGVAGMANQRHDFDLVVSGGNLANAPETNVYYELSQKYDLTYFQLPEDLLVELAKFGLRTA